MEATMPASISLIDILEVGDRFMVVYLTPGQAVNQPDRSFDSGIDAESYLHDNGFTFDPSTNTYSR
jgi:hypothetical protein